MLTAFGYDWVPGNLAGGLALERAGELATRVDIGYFITGSGASMSGGTKASLVGVIAEPSFGFRDGRIQTERGAKRVRSFRVGSKELSGVSVGSSEHFTLPRVAPRLREVNAYLGWFGPASRAMQVVSAGSLGGDEGARGRTAMGGGQRALRAGVDGWSRRGGALEERLTHLRDRVRLRGRPLSEAHIRGVDGYTFTGRMLAWGADRAAAGALKGTGALGPVDAFGLAELTEGCAWAGLSEEGSPRGGSSAQPTGSVGASAV